MAMKRFAVTICIGSPFQRAVRSIEWFSSVDDANAWCEREGLGQTPIDDEWATVLPHDAPDDDGGGA